MNPLIVIILLLFSTNLPAQTYIDVDKDDDGLIEVYNMETLNAMRYQLDGSGLQLSETAVEITTGCAPGGCKGYELTLDLDFNSADSYQDIANLKRWTDGTGWQPIGDATHPFTAIFKTNNGSTPNVIYNLMINRPGESGVGLFGQIGSSAKISGIGLLNAEITGHSQVGGLVGKSVGGDISNSYVSGRVVGKGVEVGLLAGSSSGLITNSYANGEVFGEGNGVGGLVGTSSGSITNSYAMGGVVGAANHVGGLAGNNSQGTISNCYTTGSVSGSEDIGGLVGISNLGKLVGNYVSAKTSGKRYIGGLVGINVGGTITRSYWDKTTNKLQQNTGGVGLSASELQSQNAQDDDSNKPYYKWSTANWDFGTAEQYPILKYATGSDPDNPACGPGQTLPNCGTLLLGQHASLERIMFSEQVELSPTFNPTKLNYQLDISPRITQLQLTPIASNPDSTIRISSNGLAVSTSSAVITVDKDTSITIEVSAPNQRPVQYRFTVNHLQGITIFGIPDETIDEGELIILDAFHSLDAPEDQVNYRWTQTTGKTLLSGTDNERAALFLSIPEDYVPMNEDYAKLGFSIEVTDGKTTFNKNFSLVIAKRDNGNIAVGSPSLSLLELTAPEIDLSEDPDGEGKSFAYQWQHRPPGADVEWADIDEATEQTHTISVLTEWYTEYRVLISYTDGQGYQTLATGEAIVYSLKTAFTGLLRGAASEEVPYPKDAVPQRMMSTQNTSPPAFFDCNGNNDIDDDNNGLIEICDLDGLDAIRYQPDGTGYKASRSATKITTGCAEEGCNGFELVRDLDFNENDSYRLASTKKSEWTTGGGWTPIGNSSSNAFSAIFNGNGHTISNLMINRPYTDNIGMFGYMVREASISDVGLLDVNVGGNNDVGGLVGYNHYGSITDSYATGSVTGSGTNSHVGGLIGYNVHGSITDSYATGSVTGRGTRSYVGGLIGYNVHGSITDSYATGSVTGRGTRSYVGGLVGFNNHGSITNSYVMKVVRGSHASDAGGLVGYNNYGRITNSYATGNVWGAGISDTGGLVGYNYYGGITNSYATADVWAHHSANAGGLVGRNYGTIKNSYASGKVEALYGSVDAGGLVGRNFGTIENSYATGHVLGRLNSDVGGLVGYIWRGTIKNSYAMGKVESLAMPSRVGGLVGTKTGGRITDSYWDTKTSGITTGADGTSKTTVELQEPMTATGIYLGWNGDNDNWDFGTSKQYPVLKYVKHGSSGNFTCREREEAETSLPICGDLLSPIGRGLSELQTLGGNLSPSFTAAELIYRGTVVVFDGTSEIRLRPKALNSSATISIIVDDVLLNSYLSSDTLSTTTSLSTTDITKINIEVNNGSSATTVQYTLYLNYYAYQGEAVDSNNNGLIEINSLEQLDAIRYQLDGSGYRESETMPKITQGCPEGICRGYELTKNLDFNDAASYDAMSNQVVWTTDLGWQPIGDQSNPFTGIFEGNGYTISNLSINRTGRDRGLWGYTGADAKINNIGLLQVYIVGDLRVGGLVGGNRGKIRNSYTTGTVKGLKEDLGGLVGANMKDGFIANSYSSCLVRNTGIDEGTHIGGLVGSNRNATITDSYATGAVMGNSIVGGLVGLHEQSGKIFNSYATGSVTGRTSSYIGGLIGRRSNDSMADDSYWDKQTSGQETSADGEGKLKTDLQGPTAAVGIYRHWSEKNWHFGGSNQYPILKYSDRDSENSDANNPTCRNEGEAKADLPKCGNLILPALRYGLSKLQLVRGELSPTFDVSIASYRGTFISNTNRIRIIPTTVNSSATVSISVNGMSRRSNLISGGQSRHILLSTIPTHIIIKVNNPGTLPDIRYDLYLTYYKKRRIDSDGDGLIEIDSLEKLDAMRYQLDGTGYRAGRNMLLITTGCPNNVCSGYELVKDLDFNESASEATWATGKGWQPVGSTINPFTAIFEGNSHTISNLMIDRPFSSQLGLFGVVGEGARISNIGVLDVSVNGNNHIGGLAGINRGKITNSHTSGEVSYGQAILYGQGVGGLVGNNQRTGIITNCYSFAEISGRKKSGGLVGHNYGMIRNSYASGNVITGFEIGGLVGELASGKIINSFASGDVYGDSSVGGLVGLSSGNSQIVNSYANPRSIRLGDNRAGGLVGVKTGSLRVEASYWDKETSGITDSAGGEGKTTEQLQKPMAASGIYRGWNDNDNDNWDFGTDQQYPALKYVRGDDENNPTCRERDADPTSLPICGDLLSPIARGLDKLLIVGGNLSPIFAAAEPIYRGTVVSKTNEIQLIPRALNPDAMISITDDNNNVWRDVSGTTSSSIQLDANGITKINIAVNNGSSATTVQHTLYLNYYAYKEDVDSDGDGLIDINNLEQLNSIRYQLDGTSYRESDTSHRIATGCPEGMCSGYELIQDLDFNNPEHYQTGSVNTEWTTDLGWQPIGSKYNPFTGTFEGNGYTISNLRINRRTNNNTGLFGNTGANSSIRNIGLLDVDVMGDWRVGGLAGGNSGEIRNSYTTGMVEGMLDNMGGLVGTNLAGGSIANSYSSCDVKSNGLGAGIHIGGLVGRNRGGNISDSYATEGMVSGNAKVGGLVGLNEEGGKIRNSYAIGSVDVETTTDIGGLVGANNDNDNSMVDYSYWNTDTSGIMTSAGGTSKTTVELKLPTKPGTADTDIYYDWSEVNWYFGTTEQYPALKYARDGRDDRDCRDNPLLPKCKVSLPNLRAVFLTELAISTSTLSPTFSPGILEYDVNVAFNVDEIVLDAEAPDDEPILVAANTTGTISGIGTVNATIPLTITGRTIITITVSNGNQATQYTVTVKHNRFAPGNEDLGKLPEIGPGQRDIYEGGEYRPDVRNTSSTSVYQWQRIFPLPKTFAKGPTYRVPENFVEKNQTSRKLNLILAVRNDKGIDIRNDIELTVRKRNNGSAQITATLTGTTLTASITQLDPDGMPSESEINYQWQRLDSDGKEVSVSDTHSYKIPQSTTDTTRYRVQISYTDGQDYAETTISNVVIYRNIDQDNDGLIDISTLEQLNAIRYQLDGTGYRESASTMRITAGCPVDGCKGYELIRDLDFTDNGSYRNAPLNKMEWTTGEGWEPIGNMSESFSSIFKGNGHTISNLMISSSTRHFVGLFGMINSNAVIDGIDLYKVDINGSDYVGALVGKSVGGIIINSSISGDSSSAVNKIIGTGQKVGGLVGVNTSDINKNIKGKVINSFAIARVVGKTDNNKGYSVGGLIGLNQGIVSNSYAAGDVNGRGYIGGLVGAHQAGQIHNSYARATVTGRSNIGGLVGSDNSSFITNSYWETTTTFTPTNTNGVGVSARALKSLPTDTNLYSEWSTEVWDFGTDQQYPTLKYANPQCIEVGGTNYCEDLSENQREIVESLCPERDTPDHCGKLTSGQRLGLSSVKLPKNVALLEPFASNKYDYTMLVGNKVEHIQTTPTAISLDAVVSTTTDTSGSITITVAEDNRTLTYTLTKETFDINMDAKTFDEGATPSSTSLKANLVNLGLNAFSISYNWQQQTGKALSSSAVTNEITVTIPKDYVPRDTSTSEIIMMVTATIDIAGKPVSSIARATLTINKINNGTITESLLQPEINENALTLTAPGLLGTDPDGGIDRNTITYQWQSKHSTQAVWATTGTDVVVYMIPKGTLDNTEYRVLISYTDGQGHNETTTSTSITYIDIDRDGDGLIEVSTLEELNAIRYQMDGTGYQETADATLITQGCPTTGCIGYELDTHLDFENNASYSSTLNKVTWTKNAGWDPIGSDDYTAFTSIFNGNYYTISNLMINRPTEDHVGLFGYTSNSTITAIGLWKVNIMAKDNVGGLVGTNQGLINYSDVNGDVNGSKNVGGIAGVNEGSITDSYSNKSDVSGADNIGGVVGSNGSSEFTGQITRSYYSSGTITATQSDAAGIAGDNYMGMIKDSYVIVNDVAERITNDNPICRLIGYGNQPIRSTIRTQNNEDCADN